ncbi:MAG: hypothetical protein GEU77_10090 [Deltaproteobacteria bacterium]|nr:hypothetical protein [Deltaproteobacteria bacterium]
MDAIKMDDPRLDESFAFMFSFRKGDSVIIEGSDSLPGVINDGVYIGDFPKHVAGEINPRGVTLYEIKLADESFQIVEEKEIQKAESSPTTE